MWFQLSVLLVFNSVDTKLRTFELSFVDSSSAFLKTLKNPGYMTRYSWRPKTPKMFKLVRTISDNHVEATPSLDDDVVPTLWKESTTETSVTLGNVLNSLRRDGIGDYIAYLTRMKENRMKKKTLSYTRDISHVNTLNTYENGNRSSVNDSNVFSTIATTKNNATIPEQTNFDVWSTAMVKLTKTNERMRYRRKCKAFNLVGDSIDNTLDNKKNSNKTSDNLLESNKLKYIKKIQAETIKNLNVGTIKKKPSKAGDIKLNHTENDLTSDVKLSDKKLNQTSKDVTKNYIKLKAADRKLNQSRKSYNKRDKKLNKAGNLSNKSGNNLKENKELKKYYNKLEESNKYIRESADELSKINDNYVIGNKYLDESNRLLKESENKLKDSHQYLKETDRRLKESSNKPNGSVLELKQNANINNTAYDVLKKFFSRDDIARLLANISWVNIHPSNNTTTTPYENISPVFDATNTVESLINNNNPAVKFVIPKSELYNADAVFIVFRNLTDKNENLQADYVHEDINKNYPENKYKMTKQIVFQPEKRRKTTKLFLDGDIPDWLGTKIKQFNTKLSKLNDAQKFFVTKSSLPLYRIARSLQQNYIIALNDLVQEQRIGTKINHTGKMPDKSNPLYVLPLWLSYNDKKARKARSNLFRRRYRSPNKFRIMVKPTKRHNKGQVSVYISREYKPLEDVNGSLKKYYEISPSPVREGNLTSHIEKIKNDTYVIRPNTTWNMDLQETEGYIDTYLGLRSMLLGNVGKKNNNIRKRLNPQKLCKSARIKHPFILFSDKLCDEIKTEQPNIKYNDTEDDEPTDIFTKQISLLFPKLQRVSRDLRDVSEIKPERTTNSKLLFTKQLFRNGKFDKRNLYLSPHIAQKTYKNVMLTENTPKFNNRRRKKTSNNKIKNMKKSYLKHEPKYGTPRLTGFKRKGNNDRAIDLNKNYYGRKSSSFSGKLNEYGFSKDTFQMNEASKNTPNRTSDVHIDIKTKVNSIDYRVKPISFITSQQVESYSSTEIIRQAPNTTIIIKKEKLSNTKNVTEPKQKANTTKNSIKRELGSFSMFDEPYTDFNEEHNREEIYNVDIGAVAQAGEFEQFEASDEWDAEKPTFNNTGALIYKKSNEIPKHTSYRRHSKGGTSFYTHPVIKDTVWANPIKQNTTPKNMFLRSKHKQGKPASSDKKVADTGSANLYGYENLSTARKLYADLDPLKPEENSITHFDKEHGVKYNRAISSNNLHPQVDDYNDEFLRDTNVEPNRIGVDYINYNYLGPGFDFPEYGQGKYDKYSEFVADVPALEEKLNVGLHDINPTRKDYSKSQHNWHKADLNYHAKTLSNVEMLRRTSAKKPQRVRPKLESAFDYENNIENRYEKRIHDKLNLNKNNQGYAGNFHRKFHKLSTTTTSLPKPADVINDYYDRNKKRKQSMHLQEKSTNGSNWTNHRDERRNKTKGSQQQVYIHNELTTEIVAEESLFKNMNVYMHKRRLPMKKNNLHNSRHLLELWSKNHETPTGNSIIVGVSPLDIWSHKASHVPKPTPEDVDQPDEVEFERRKRDTNMRRSRLVCCLVKRPDQQELVGHVKATWGSRCDVIVLITSKKGETHDLWEYTKAGLRFIYELHYQDADWILKADIDSYVVIENLKNMVKDYDPDTPLYFGRLGLTDFSNFVVSKEALKMLVTRSQESEPCQGTTDDGIGYCMEYLGIKAVDSRDDLGRARFYPFSPFDFKPEMRGEPDEALNKWSDYAVAFANVNYKDMYTLDFFIYKVYPLSSPRDILLKVNKESPMLEDISVATKPPHSKPRLTENLITHFKYIGNGSVSDDNVEKFKDQVRQLKGLF